jgi:hypothetical protein
MNRINCTHEQGGNSSGYRFDPFPPPEFPHGDSPEPSAQLLLALTDFNGKRFLYSCSPSNTDTLDPVILDIQFSMEHTP